VKTALTLHTGARSRTAVSERISGDADAIFSHHVPTNHGLALQDLNINAVAYLVKTRTVKPAETTVARKRLYKHAGY
jgi:hypothetical protein